MHGRDVVSLPLISAVLLVCLRSLAVCSWSPSFLPPLSNHPHSILQVLSTPPTKLTRPYRVLQIPLGQGAVGVGTGSLTVMNSTGNAVQFHHSKNCSHGTLNTVKTNKSKYLELIHGGCLATWPHPRGLLCFTVQMHCQKLALHFFNDDEHFLKKLGSVLFFLPPPLLFAIHPESMHPYVHLVVKSLHCSLLLLVSPFKKQINIQICSAADRSFVTCTLKSNRRRLCMQLCYASNNISNTARRIGNLRRHHIFYTKRKYEQLECKIVVKCVTATK